MTLRVRGTSLSLSNFILSLISWNKILNISISNISSLVIQNNSFVDLKAEKVKKIKNFWNAIGSCCGKYMYKVLWLQIPGTHFKLLEAKRNILWTILCSMTTTWEPWVLEKNDFLSWVDTQTQVPKGQIKENNKACLFHEFHLHSLLRNYFFFPFNIRSLQSNCAPHAS